MLNIYSVCFEMCIPLKTASSASAWEMQSSPIAGEQFQGSQGYVGVLANETSRPQFPSSWQMPCRRLAGLARSRWHSKEGLQVLRAEVYSKLKKKKGNANIET